MKISVVMTTYNGEKYILKQLESLIAQTRLPDEIIIRDDGSNDSTEMIINKFIEENPSVKYDYKKNKKNMGWKKNFIEAIKECSGDIIFTCDQDDIWYSNKIECMTDVMMANEKIMLLASDYDLKYAEHNFKYSKEKLKKYPLNEKFMFIKRPGCVFCFRKELFNLAYPYCFDEYPHDALLWRYANITDSLYLYHEPTIYYRRHESTATGHDKKNVMKKLEGMRYYQKAISNLISFIEDEKSMEGYCEKKNLLLQIKTWCDLRMQFLKTGKLILWFKLMKYIKFFYNKKSYFADLLMRCCSK